tara:strand:- start:60 stop:422 length:363 start_codon:yes stop_codon:yes gene_type:complete
MTKDLWMYVVLCCAFGYFTWHFNNYVFADDFYCYDGDTCYLNNEPLRLLGVDTPELPSQEGYLAKYFVNDWLATADSVEIVFSGRRGYYGRQLVDIYIDGQNLSNVLIERGYGKVYGYRE